MMEGQHQIKNPICSSRVPLPMMEPVSSNTASATTPTTSSSSGSRTVDVPSADCLRLILAHLTESGLHETARTLRRESGVGLAAAPWASNWPAACASGQWATVLRVLSELDRDRARLPVPLLAAVHEMAVLELAEGGDWDAAHAVFRLLQRDEPLARAASEMGTAAEATGGSSSNNSNNNPRQGIVTVSRSLEQKLAQLAAARQRDPSCAAPDDYYGSGGSSSSKQARREALGRQLREAVPRQPPQRLVTLLQQAVQWQSYTGQLPRVRQWWRDDDGDDDTAGKEGEDDETKKSKKKRKRQEFDLVLGEVTVDPSTVTASAAASGGSARHIAKDYATISFGKKATCESAVFLPGTTTTATAGGGGLVTGSSDGLIEVHDLQGQLRTADLPYQARDEYMGHDRGAAVTAVAVSNDGQLLASGGADGTVHVWRLATGRRLRTLAAGGSGSSGSSGIACLALAPHGSQLLVGQGTGDCREFGLRSGRMLREFKGHASYLTSCLYRLVAMGGGGGGSNIDDDDDESNDNNGKEQLVVVTASGDGSVRFWNAQTADPLWVWHPVSLGRHLSPVGASLVAAAAAAADDRPAVLGLHPLHAPAYTWIVVPRGRRAFLVDFRGKVLQIYQDDGSSTAHEKVFVASAVSATNRWLYAVRDDGACCVFDVTTGKLHDTLRDFGSLSTKGKAEVSCLVHHSSKDLVAAFSNDKGQKKGKLVLWKA